MARVATIEATIEQITPEMAEILLKNNQSNRHCRQTRVETYALQMQAGMWRADSNDAILISEDGEVLNGQHRLNAVIRAGVPVKMAVRRGVDKEMFKVLDQGLGRTTADFMDSFPNKTTITTCARIMAAIKHGPTPFSKALRGRLSTDAMIPNDWVIDEVESNYEAYQSCALHATRFRRQIRKGSLAAVMTFIMLMPYLGKGDKLNEFIEDFSANQSVIPAAATLKQTIVTRNLKGAETSTRELLALLIYAYDKYLEGAAPQVLAMNYAIEAMNKCERLAIEKYNRKAGA